MKSRNNPISRGQAAAWVCAMLVLGCGGEPPAQSAAAPAARNVRVEHPHRGAITRSITLPGTVRAYQEATLYAKVAGYLKTIAVDKGDEVEAGKVLATLEVPEFSSDLARGQVEMAQAEHDDRRLAEAHERSPNLVVPQTVDDARARFEMARANVTRIRSLLAYTTIAAPFSGVISHRWADPGAFIPAATSGSTPQNSAIVTLTDLGRVRVQFAVPEAEVRFVVAGAPVEFSVEGLPGRSFSGQVTRYSHVVDDASKSMLTEVEYGNDDRTLRPGMYATVRLVVERKTDALLVPLEAVLWEKAKASVFSVAEGKSRKIPVKIGFADAAHAEVVDGIDQATTVILLGKQPMEDNVAVEASEAR